MLKYSESPLSQSPYFSKAGGASRGIFGGASLETFSGEAQLKKPPCIIEFCEFYSITQKEVLNSLWSLVRSYLQTETYAI